MDSAKKAVKDFLHRAGKDSTDVKKRVAPAVTHQNIERQQHEEVTTAVDREIHQDHYHTTIQPITDTEVLPEQHHHYVAPVEHREFDHGNVGEDQRAIHAEASKFQNEITHTEGASTSTANSTTGSTHIHHHVYETVQPVLERKVIERHVIHTTAPVLETHHNPAEHHDASTLPAVSMDEFQRRGGALSGHVQELASHQNAPQTTGILTDGGSGSQRTQSVQNGAETGATRNVSTGVAGNAAVTAARAAAMGQRSQ